MSAPQPTLSVANYLLGKAMASGRPLTPMALIKQVYIAHGWYLAYFNRPLISDAVEAWKYGPVIPSLYHGFKHFGGSPITAQATVWNESGQLVVPIVQDQETQKFLDSVYNAYASYSGGQLSDLTHRTDTPWSQVWNANHGSEYRGAVIPADLIRDHYKRLLVERTNK